MLIPNLKSVFLQEQETLGNPENIFFFQIIWCFRFRLTKIDTGFRFCRSKNPWIVSHQFGKFSLSRKFRVDNSECHACNYGNREKVKTSKIKFFFFNQGSVFWRWNSNREFVRYGSRVSSRQAAMRFDQRLRRFTSSYAACNRHCRAA